MAAVREGVTMEDPQLTLFTRPSCDLCREAQKVLDGVEIPYVLRRVSLDMRDPSKLHVWDDRGNVVGWANLEEIPAVPALLVRDRAPALVFASFEQIVAFAAGRTFAKNRSPEPQQQPLSG